jgi:ribose transport system permease protein
MRAFIGRFAAPFFSSYGMLGVLLLLCAYFTFATYRDEPAMGRPGAIALAESLATLPGKDARVVIVAQSGEDEFVNALRDELQTQGFDNIEIAQGEPPDVRARLETLARSQPPDVAAVSPSCRDWPLFESVKKAVPALSNLEVRAPEGGRRSAFLSPSNLSNIADQTAVIAIMAIGMTLVIITGGIDLSVGSLLALSAVTAAYLIGMWGGADASSGSLLAASSGAVLLCTAVGAFSALMITLFRIPPFIATLAMMQVASGLAFIVTKGQSLYDIPASFTWLGRGTGLFSLPNSVWLMIVLYIFAHVLMTRTVIGRHIYAVGGNAQAARYGGINVNRNLAFVYIVSGFMAGLGGVITASQLKAGAPTYGQGYELYVIAAAVVGGTSLSGGEGRIFGTLIGAFIIAVIRNGMNLMNVESYTQKVVLGLVILGAVLLDMLRRRKRA